MNGATRLTCEEAGPALPGLLPCSRASMNDCIEGVGRRREREGQSSGGRTIDDVHKTSEEEEAKDEGLRMKDEKRRDPHSSE